MEKLYRNAGLYFFNVALNTQLAGSVSRPDKFYKTGIFAQGLLFTAIFLLMFCHANAVTKTFTGPGNFSDATRWTSSTRPVAGDILRINGICTVDNSALTDNIAYGSLEIGRTSA